MEHLARQLYPGVGGSGNTYTAVKMKTDGERASGLAGQDPEMTG